MEIRTILVNLDVDAFSPAVVTLAGALAERFGADLIGLAAAEPSTAILNVDGGIDGSVDGAVAAAAWYAEEREEIEKRLASLEAEFRRLAPSAVKLDWRGSVQSPNSYLVGMARSADLIVTGSPRPAGHLRSVDVGELVLTAGRPVLVAGAGGSEDTTDKIVVAWKDTREARRAVVDALPLLKAASEVIVATFDEGDADAERRSLGDVLAWLRRHDVKASGDLYPATGGLAASLESLAMEIGADLIVMGSHGHAPLREWLFGGMTHDMLATTTINRLMSN